MKYLYGLFLCHPRKLGCPVVCLHVTWPRILFICRHLPVSIYYRTECSRCIHSGFLCVKVFFPLRSDSGTSSSTRHLQSLENSVRRAGAGSGLGQDSDRTGASTFPPCRVCHCAWWQHAVLSSRLSMTGGHVSPPVYTDLGVQGCTARWVCVPLGGGEVP